MKYLIAFMIVYWTLGFLYAAYNMHIGASVATLSGLIGMVLFVFVCAEDGHEYDARSLSSS